MDACWTVALQRELLFSWLLPVTINSTDVTAAIGQAEANMHAQDPRQGTVQ